jgi:hypothetical protein
MEAGTCYCDFDGHDVVQCYREQLVKARKRYECPECGVTIDVGSQYWRLDYFGHDGWCSDKRCQICKKIADDYCCRILGEGTVRDTVWDVLGVDLKTGKIDESFVGREDDE